MLNRLKLKTAGKIYAVMGLITVLIHLGVLVKIIPYTWINGGRSASYESAVATSSGGIIFIVILTIIILLASELIKVKYINPDSKILRILVWIIVGLSSLSIVLQFLGTTFEIVFVSIIAITLLLTSLRIALK